jgi:hypothetical protein
LVFKKTRGYMKGFSYTEQRRNSRKKVQFVATYELSTEKLQLSTEGNFIQFLWSKYDE